jgi:hypothetical protein
MAGRRWGRVVSASAGCLLAGVLSLAVWCTAAQAAPLCVVRGHSVRGVHTSKVIEITSRAVIYRTTSLKAEEYGPKYTDVWACGRKSHRFVAIAVEEFNEEYGTEGMLSGFHVAGNWLIVTQETGQTGSAECGKYQAAGSQECPSASESLLVVNVASGLEGSISTLPADTAMLSADGAVAWWSQTQEKEKEAISSLYGCVTTTTRRKLLCKPRLVAQGSIPAASVRLVGTTLSWDAAGQQQSSVL